MDSAQGGKVRRHKSDLHLLGIRVSRESSVSGPDSRDILEQTIALLNLAQQRTGGRPLGDRELVIIRPNQYQLFRAFVSQRAQQNGVHYAEDCGVRTDSQS